MQTLPLEVSHDYCTFLTQVGFSYGAQKGEGKTEIKGEKQKRRDGRKLENSRKTGREENEKWKIEEEKERLYKFKGENKGYRRGGRVGSKKEQRRTR